MSKGAVYERLSKDIHIGESSSEIMSYLDTLEINGVKAERGDYVKGGYTVTASDGRAVEAKALIGVMFRDEKGTPDFCRNIGAILYFDSSDKLINYNIDCFGDKSSGSK